MSFVRFSNEIYKIIEGKPTFMFFTMLKEAFPYSKGSIQRLKQADFESAIKRAKDLYGNVKVIQTNSPR